MKTKLTLLTVLAAALFVGGCASTGELVSGPTLTPSRNVLLNVGGANKDFVNFRLTGSAAIIENATQGSRFSSMIGKCAPFVREDPTVHYLRVGGWVTTWIFKPDGTAEAREGYGPTKGYAVQVSGKTLDWPKALVDASTGEKKSGPQTRNMLLDSGGRGILINVQIQGNKVTIINNPDNPKAINRSFSFGEIDDEGLFTLNGWTQRWFCLSDGTASVKERPLSDGIGLAIPVQGNTLKWPK